MARYRYTSSIRWKAINLRGTSGNAQDVERAYLWRSIRIEIHVVNVDLLNLGETTSPGTIARKARCIVYTPNS